MRSYFILKSIYLKLNLGLSCEEILIFSSVFSEKMNLEVTKKRLGSRPSRLITTNFHRKMSCRITFWNISQASSSFHGSSNISKGKIIDCSKKHNASDICHAFAPFIFFSLGLLHTIQGTSHLNCMIAISGNYDILPGKLSAYRSN